MSRNSPAESLAGAYRSVGQALSAPGALRTLLLVDDEAAILSALRRELRSCGYEILLASDGNEGLQLLRATEVQVILSDYRMPGMNGVEFLAAARGICPEAVRMILSGYADIEAVVAAINQGHIFKFLGKPWNGNDLRMAISDAFEYHASMRRGAQFLRVFESASEGIVILDANGSIESANPALCAITGYAANELAGQPLDILRATERQDNDSDATWDQALATADRWIDDRWSGELWGRRKNGEMFPLAIRLSMLRDSAGRAFQKVGLCTDITERKQREVALIESEKRFRDFMEFAPIGMVIVDLDGRLMKVNQALCHILGYERTVLEGMRFEDLTHPDDIATDLSIRRRLLMGELPIWRAEKRYARADGSLVWVQLTASVLRDTQGIAQCFDVQIEDVTERRHDQERIRHLAYYDTLTGLPNRRLLQDRLAQALAHARRSEKLAAVAFVDLDCFKQVNDIHGHETGDMLLKLAAQRLSDCLRRGDTVARQGGDEFILVLSEIGDAAGIARIASKVGEALARPYDLTNGVRIDAVSASIGVAIFPLHGRDAEELMKRADIAMYVVKEAGRNAYRIFDNAMETSTSSMPDIVSGQKS